MKVCRCTYDVYMTKSDRMFFDLGQARTILFHQDINWKTMNNWLKTRSSTPNVANHDYAFVTREQQMVIEESDKISAAIEAGQSVTIDVISREVVVQVVCSYEVTSERLSMLKSTKIASLLNNENLRKRFNINETISQNLSILFEEDNNQTTLSNEELKQTLGDFCESKKQPIHFRIAMSSSVIIYCSHESINVPMTKKDLTVEELLPFIGKSMDVERYLASKITKRVFAAADVIFDLGEREFLLLEEKDIRHVCVDESGDQNDRLFAVSATIADIRQAFELDDQYFLSSDDFIPSAETLLISFRAHSPIRLTILDRNLPASVTVRNEQQPARSVQLNCAHSMLISRLCSISCQLFGVNNDSCQLTLSDGTRLDGELSLMDIDEDMSDIELRLIVPEGLSCSIICAGQTVLLPCDETTTASSLLREAVEKLFIPSEYIDRYSIFALDDEQTEIHPDTTVDDIRDLLSSSKSIIPLVLKRNDN